MAACLNELPLKVNPVEHGTNNPTNNGYTRASSESDYRGTDIRSYGSETLCRGFQRLPTASASRRGPPDN